MLAFSPPLFSTNYGWPLVDDFMITDSFLQQDNDNNGIFIQSEANSYHSLLDFPTYDHIPNQYFTTEHQTSISSGGAGSHGEAMMVAKKLNHNASERDRRKRVNDSYAFLCSLLPMPTDHRKKVSIPATVSLALSYIPQLQKEVEGLRQKKEKVLLSSSSTREEHDKNWNQSVKEVMANQRKSSLISSVTILDENKAMIQLSTLIDDPTNKKKNKEMGFFSKALEYLEEEDGLVLLNANTHKWYGDKSSILNTFQFQVQGNHKIEAEKLKEKLCTIYQQSREVLC